MQVKTTGQKMRKSFKMYTDHRIAMLTNLILCALRITFKKLHENISQEWNQRIENQ